MPHPASSTPLAFLADDPDGFAAVQLRDAYTGEERSPVYRAGVQDFAALVQRVQQQAAPRWVMLRTGPWLKPLLEQNVYLPKAYVLSLAQRIIHRNQDCAPIEDVDLEHPQEEPAVDQLALFAAPRSGQGLADLTAMYGRQMAALPEDPVRRAKLMLLLHAESVGALIAAEMEYAGLSWDEPAHRRLLREALGPRVPEGHRPPKLEQFAGRLAEELGTAGLNPDSPQELLRALHKAGFAVQSVRAWELERINHPLINMVLEYKKLSRLASTHGDHWLDRWVDSGRFHPHYVLGTVASGRWAASGGGALQLPHSIRQVVRTAPGRCFVVADGRQLEPRILAAISHDAMLQRAGAQDDLYQWLIDAGVAADRSAAKLGMLSVIYGGSAGGDGKVAAALRRSFPAAMDFVQAAADAGERGQAVSSFLGRGCPPADEQWLRSQRSTSDEASQRAANAAARSRGRFTRNFVVQSTAAEWALLWMGHARHLMHQAGLFWQCPQVFFVHDEVVFECPVERAEQVAGILRDAAALAGRTLFGARSPRFPVSIAVTDCYGEAK